MARTATRFVLEFMGEVNRLQGTIAAGSSMLARIAGRWATHLRIGAGGSLPAPLGSGYQPPYQLDSPLPVQVLEASPKGHYTQ